MKPILFAYDSFIIGSYGVLVAIGLSVAICFFYLRAKKAISLNIIIEFSLLMILSSFLGAKFFHAISHNNIEGGLDFWQSGLTYYGGFITNCIFGYVYIRLKRLKIADILDMLAPSLAIGESIGRIGCLLAGCCFGCQTNSIFGISYPKSSLAYILLDGQKAYPTQIFSSISLFVLFILLIFIDRYKIFSGQLFLIYAIIHSIQRFIIDFFRYYSPGEHIGVFVVSQIISLAIALIAFFIMIIMILQRHKQNKL